MPDKDELITGITGSSQTTETPQFATAEYAHAPGKDHCQFCNSAIAGEYYRVNEQMACSKCALEAREGLPSDTHTAFARALLYGIGAAVVGMILYSTVAIITGWTIGYLALAVGWLVSAGMIKGSNGMGGRKYQIAAVLLTYAAISLSAIPIWIASSMKDHGQGHQQSQSAGQAGTDGNAGDHSGDGGSKAASAGAFVGAMAMLALIGIASPFLELADPFHGLIGLVILFVGLNIAYRKMAARPLSVDGPYSVTG
jgi:hypothetical protein